MTFYDMIPTLYMYLHLSVLH